MTMTFNLDGVELLQKEMKEYGPTVSKRAGDQGTRKAARWMARNLRNAAPRGESGRLRRSIGFKYYPRTGWAKVGLRRARTDKSLPGYYKTLEFGRAPYKKRGKIGGSYFRYAGSPPMNRYFSRTAYRLVPSAAQMMIDETRNALFNEARKVYQRSQINNARRKK